MKKTHKLLFVFAVFAAVALIFAAAALAEDEPPAATANPTVSGNTVSFSKGITLINMSANGTYYGPSITYTYSIHPATTEELASIVNGDATVTTKPGPVDSVSFIPFDQQGAPALTGQIEFISDKQSFTTTGAPYIPAQDAPPTTATLFFNMNKFNAPGVYRYVLTDTTPISTLYDAGIVRPSTYANPLYLDIYVENAPNGGYQIREGGAVLVASTSGITSTTAKAAGFEDDTYYTINVSVTKEVTGNMGDKGHEFPFTISVKNLTGETDSNMKYFTTDHPNTGSYDGISDGTVSATLKNGKTFEILGLNSKATISVTETNNTSETYTVTITGAGSTAFNSGTVLPGGNITATLTENNTPVTDLAVTNYNTANTRTGENANVSTSPQATAAAAIKFTNNCDAISPTGLVLRYGPFALLLAGAACFFLIGRRRKESEEESDRI